MKQFVLLLILAIPAFPVCAQKTADVVCSYAPSQSKTVAAISGAAGGAGASIGAVAAATGLTVVTHSSGAAILTGSAGYIAGTLGAAGAAPVIVGVSLLVGGVAVTVELICASKNRPDQVAKVQEAAAEFSRRFNDAIQSTKVAAGNMKKTVVPAAEKTVYEVKRNARDAWEYGYRKSAELGASLGK
jgi:hypothetical protein